MLGSSQAVPVPKGSLLTTSHLLPHRQQARAGFVDFEIVVPFPIYPRWWHPVALDGHLATVAKAELANLELENKP